jgi:hypothetical protein
MERLNFPSRHIVVCVKPEKAVEADLALNAKMPVLLIDPDGVSVDGIHFRPLAELLCDLEEAVFPEKIVTVQPALDIAGCPLEAFDKAERLAAIRLTDPIGNMLLVLADNLNRLVPRAAVDDDEFEVGIPLIQYTAQRALKEGCLIE